MNEIVERKKSKTRMTASVLKQDPNTYKVQRILFILINIILLNLLCV